jgi:archaellum component FlaG (FlaF/FlaG flagellin family)
VIASLLVVAILIGAGAGYIVGSAGERTVTTVSTTTATVDYLLAYDPVEVLSVTGPIPPYNFAGPDVSVVVKNTGDSSIVALNANLRLYAFDFTFTFGVKESNVLLPGQIVQATQTLTYGLIQDGANYPLTVNGTLASGQSFSFTVQIEMVSPN